jgi:hypothetical protein
MMGFYTAFLTPRNIGKMAYFPGEGNDAQEAGSRGGKRKLSYTRHNRIA